MKQIMKKAAAVAAVLALGFTASAQELKLGVGGDFMAITGASLFGGHVQAEKPFTDNISGALHVGYMAGGDETGFISYSQIHAIASGRYYTGEIQKGLYFGPELGLYSTTAEVEFTFFGTTTTTKATVSDFVFGAGAGYQLESFDIGLRYTTSTAGGIAIRAAYLF